MDLNQLSRGNQYIHLLRIEYMDLLRQSRLTAYSVREALKRYTYSAEDLISLEHTLKTSEIEIQYYTQILEGMGAENEESVLTAQSPSAESPQYAGESCITV